MIKLYLNKDSAKTRLDLNLEQYSQFWSKIIEETGIWVK